MTDSRRRLATALVMLMIIAPFANAGMASWNTTNTINPNGDELTITGFRVPGNGTVMDGWVHVTNTDLGTAADSSIVLEGDDLLAGSLNNVVYDEELEAVLMMDDGTRSDISDFAAGDITATLSNQYKSGPGYTMVYSSTSVTTTCNNSSGYEVSYGFDENFNGVLNTNEISNLLYFCDVTQQSSNGTNTTYNALVSFAVEPFGSNCEHGGYKISSGIDWDDDRSLSSSEIDSVSYICHNTAIWGPAILSTMNGTLYGPSRITSYGVIPSTPTDGAVVAASLPGEAVPAGTDTWLIAPKLIVPASSVMNSYWMTFDHWYHVDSTASGEGDGAWVEYRIKNGTWTNWSWIAPDGGYPSTLSEDGPDVTGAPSTGDLPVFASPIESGWVTSNLSLSSIPDIDSASEIQMRFRLWTHPDATTERPGWFIDNIEYNNDGIDYGVWHHGCIVTAPSTCNYANNAYGALQRTIDLTGTNNASSIEIDMEWDLQGSYSDNACVELSVNNNTWTDISSSASSSTVSACEDRLGAIPGNGYTDKNDVTYYDESGGFRTIELDVPNAFYGQPSVEIRIIVDTDTYNGYGGIYPGDSREGLSVKGMRVYTNSSSPTLSQDIDFETSTTFSSYLATPPSGAAAANEWAYYTFSTGDLFESLGFEDSGANNPTVNDASGWSRSSSSSATAAKWSLGQLGSSAGPNTQEPSFPYVYGVNLNGQYANNVDAYLKSPSYVIPANSSATLTFNKWVCTESYWDAVGLYIKVNNAAWQPFDPGIAGWYDGSPGYSGNAMYGQDVWMNGDCLQTDFENRQASLAAYAGDTVKFRFRIWTDSSVPYEGGYIDDFGILIPNYSSTGFYTSPSLSLDDSDVFNHGWIDIDALIPTNTSLLATLIDSSTGEVVAGIEGVEFPISLAGVDPALHPDVKVRVDLDSANPEVTPRIKKLALGGMRYLTAESFEGNSWEMSPSIEVIDDLINATSVAGTITSPYIQSSRPIKSISLSGNYSSTIPLTAYDSNGAQIGTGGASGVAFTYPVTGFALSIALPTNGWIDRMVFTANFAEHATNPSIDVIADGTTEWSFPKGDDYGHFGWQSFIADESEVVSQSFTLGGATPSSLTIRIPTSASLYGGLIAITSQSADGFAGSVTVSVEGASQSGGAAGSHIFYNTLNAAQVGAINAEGTGHTDSDTGREWRNVDIEISSTVSQDVSLARFGIGYLIFENISGLGPSIDAYHGTQTTDDPPPELVNIPVSISAETGILNIDGDVRFDYIITNRDFSTPNTFYPTGESYSITTRHHHLHDNSQLSEIVLRALASDGESIEFKVTNSADGLWGMGTESVTFSQVSGDGLMPLDLSASYIVEELHNDGYTDITVNWNFDISWNWDDVDSIRWVSKALDSYGETVWPAVSHSGQSGKKAIENDLQIDSFEIRDQYDRLISNQFSTFYPYPVREGSMLNVTGNVRFQDSNGTRPIGTDFQVRLNLTGSLLLMNSADDGQFYLNISAPSGISEVTASPELFRVGPISGAIGAEDTSGAGTTVIIQQDSNPPTVGVIEVNTATGLTPANGKVWDPSLPLSLFVTIEEAEARGEIITLNYWRSDMDDLNGDGIADEDEYLSQIQTLSTGMTGQQQVNFVGIDVSSQSFNSPVHVYLEGTDWAGLTYQEGGTGGGPGADDAWATVIVATDEPTSIVSAGYSLDRETGYLLPGAQHTFRMQINEPNGIHTLDNVSVMLCGDGLDNLGKFSYNPVTGNLWSADDSFVLPISVQTQQITANVIELSMLFELSWEFPWEDDQYPCKPSISVVDDITEVAFDNNIGELSWELDNKLVAIPSGMNDLSPPVIESTGIHLYLQQGDQFQMSGEIYYANSMVIFTDTTEDMQVDMEIIYGTQKISGSTVMGTDGTWDSTLSLPMRVPLNPTMSLTTTVLNVPGVGSSTQNSDGQVTVDSKRPTVLFDQINYPDSSLTYLESDLLEEVTVSVTIIDEIGMPDEDLQVAWVFIHNNLPVSGTEDSGSLSILLQGDGSEVFQGKLDFTPLITWLDQATNEECPCNGDRILFWVTSADQAGNEIQGLGSEASPRPVALRIMNFEPEMTNMVINPKDPFVDERVTIETFWKNDGKREGTITLSLYELSTEGNWYTDSSEQTIDIPAQSSSIRAVFEWVPGEEGTPVLHITIGENPIVNGNLVADSEPVNGILVKPLIDPTTEQDSSMTYVIMGGVFIVAVGLVGFFVSRSRSDDEEYYYEDEEGEYYENDWESEEDEDDADS